MARSDVPPDGGPGPIAWTEDETDDLIEECLREFVMGVRRRGGPKRLQLALVVVLARADGAEAVRVKLGSNHDQRVIEAVLCEAIASLERAEQVDEWRKVRIAPEEERDG